MNLPSRRAFLLRPLRRPSVLCLLALALTAPLQAAAPVVSVFSRAMNGYTRQLTPDGSFKPESFTFAQGERLSGQLADPSIDEMPFLHVAQAVSDAMRTQNYVPGVKPEETDLMIYVSWGTTTGSDNGRFTGGYDQLAAAMRAGQLISNQWGQLESQAQVDLFLTLNGVNNEARDRNNFVNASILGYNHDLRDASFMKMYATGFATDVISEVEEDRYFVVLRAFDMKTLVKEKKMKQLWETRFSIRQFGHRFDRALPAMSRYASRFYGQDIGRLVRQPMRSTDIRVGPVTEVGQD